MTWAAIAIGGSTAVGAGVGLTQAFMGQSAAKDAASTQQQALFNALQAQRGTTAQMLQYFDPFRQMGLQAGRALTSELYSPQQQIQTGQMTLDSLNRQLTELKRIREGYNTGMGVPLLTGKNASEKRQSVWQQMIVDNEAQQAALRDQIKQQEAMVTQAKANAANPTALSDIIEQNPMFTAGQNVISRRLAAQGLQGSQEAIRQEGTLAANVFQNQIANQLGIYQPTVGQAGQMATNIMASGQAQGNTIAAAGQAQAQGILNANQALWGGIGNAANSLSAGAGAMLNYDLYNKLIGSLGSQQTQARNNFTKGQGTLTHTSVEAGNAANERAWTSQSFGMGS